MEPNVQQSFQLQVLPCTKRPGQSASSQDPWLALLVTGSHLSNSKGLQVRNITLVGLIFNWGAAATTGWVKREELRLFFLYFGQTSNWFRRQKAYSTTHCQIQVYALPRCFPVSRDTLMIDIPCSDYNAVCRLWKLSSKITHERVQFGRLASNCVWKKVNLRMFKRMPASWSASMKLRDA